MTFKEFLDRPQIVKRLLNSLGILVSKRTIIKINTNPDYNISDYQREDDADYYFKNHWDFSTEKISLTAADFLEERLLHFDHFEKAADELQLVFNRNNPIGFVESVYAIDPSWFSENGFETDIDQFKLKQLRVIAIDNINTRLHYDGSFFSNHDSFEPIDWGLYAVIELTGVNREMPHFYHDLVAESFLLFNQQQYRLSYFLAYTAFESFIIAELINGNEPGRLRDKVSGLYIEKFHKLDTHQIFSCFMLFFDWFTTNRHNIAHGDGNVVISKEDAECALMYILMMMGSYAFNIATFDELKRRM